MGGRMRDINRIDKILSLIGEEWKKAPDLRFGQLFFNLQRWENNNLFDYKDEKLINCLQDYMKEALGRE